MNGESGSEAGRDDCGRFSGARFNVEQVPRLPTFPARWALEDPRGRPYLVFWTTEGGSLIYPLRMQRIDSGQAVKVTKPSGASQPIEIVRRPSPNRTGTMILYVCPVCEKPRRYLYRLTVSGGRLADYFGLQCQSCAGLRWASQGRYRNKLARTMFGALSGIYGQRVPEPRSLWDPRAVSDPQIVVDEFPDDLREPVRSVATVGLPPSGARRPLTISTSRSRKFSTRPWRRSSPRRRRSLGCRVGGSARSAVLREANRISEPSRRSGKRSVLCSPAPPRFCGA